MEQLVDLIGRYGALFVFANVLMEQAGLPVPALPTLLLAGALAAAGSLSVAQILIAAVAASLLADGAWFVVGRRAGYRALHAVCRVSVSPESCVRQTESIFERFGMLSLVIAKFIPGYSTLAPPLAGMLRTSTPVFLAYTTVGAAVWAGSAVVGGLLFHRVVDRLVRTLDALGSLGVALLVVGLGLYLLVRWARLVQFRRALGLARISAVELRDLVDDGRDPLILDVRSKLSYESDPRIIPGAVRFHLGELDEKLGGIARDRELILYCT